MRSKCRIKRVGLLFPNAETMEQVMKELLSSINELVSFHKDLSHLVLNLPRYVVIFSYKGRD